MKIIIRKATVYDMDSILEIENACFKEDLRFDKNLFYLFLLGKNGEIFLVADEYFTEKRKVIAGFVISFLNKQLNFEVITLNVHPDSQRKGIGFKLMTQMEEKIKERLKNNKFLDKITLELMVYEKNKPALSLYNKLGYKEVEKIPNYYRKSRAGIRMLKTLKLED